MSAGNRAETDFVEASGSDITWDIMERVFIGMYVKLLCVVEDKLIWIIKMLSG